MIVLDASAAIDIATANVTDPVGELLRSDVLVPPTFYVETAAYALRALVRQPEVAAELRDLMWSLVTDVQPLTHTIALATWDLCDSLSFPDATYVATAALHEAELWTTDGRLARNAGQLPCTVHLLARG